ncbi:hypothetical protein [Streptomyces sp. NPDC048659]|uniref:hypothetical protein n=1 Tax=Streptomyces sp. NPDC048659 TaxID=3155489 RepID=UPI00343171F5
MDRPLLSPRSTLVILLAVLAGIAAGVLTTLAGEGTARSVLAGLAAGGLAVPFFNHLVGTEEPAARPRTPAGTDGGEHRG